MTKAQITFDRRGISVWPEDVKLKYDGEEWFDTECEVRGTNGGFDHEAVERLTGVNMELGQRIIVNVTTYMVAKFPGGIAQAPSPDFSPDPLSGA